jgi:hypothetical protein
MYLKMQFIMLEMDILITEIIAGEWKSAEKLLLSSESSSKTYLIEGDAYGCGLCQTDVSCESKIPTEHDVK